jgi:hypothetical protein
MPCPFREPGKVLKARQSTQAEQPRECPANALETVETRHFKKTRQETPANALVIPTDPRNLLEYIEKLSCIFGNAVVASAVRRGMPLAVPRLLPRNFRKSVERIAKLAV